MFLPRATSSVVPRASRRNWSAFSAASIPNDAVLRDTRSSEAVHAPLGDGQTGFSEHHYQERGSGQLCAPLKLEETSGARIAGHSQIAERQTPHFQVQPL